MSQQPKQRWRCRTCNAMRKINPCWKCGIESTHKVPDDWPSQEDPPVNKMREVARNLGYCLALHGSQERDFDIVAVPWVEDAASAEALIDALVKSVETENGPARIASAIAEKPNGRLALNIQMNGWYKVIDLSITPRKK